LAFSCRERAGKAFKMPTISRAAVNCNAVFGRPVHLSIRSHITEREGEYAMK
jgi:hypothetical protein